MLVDFTFLLGGYWGKAKIKSENNNHMVCLFVCSQLCENLPTDYIYKIILNRLLLTEDFLSEEQWESGQNIPHAGCELIPPPHPTAE